MFIPFFYLLRKRGLNVSPSEWMTLLEALDKGMHHSSLSDFYYLCRAIIVHDEADFDRFDQAFLEFFKDVPFREDIPEEVMNWLDKPLEDLQQSMQELLDMGFPAEDMDELLKMLEERLKEQDEEHNGGSYWIGTGGRSPFGHGGWHPNGIRIGGESHHRTAMSVAGERKFRDFRKDNVLDTRKFQMAFRTLRQLSNQVITSEEELDVDKTIRDTCDNAGNLKVRYKHPRRNAIKLLLLMDSGGSMEYYSELCSMLFQAATKSNHFKELHTYYFHNCIYDHVFTSPTMDYNSQIDTQWLMDNYDHEYRVIIVGDAAMNQGELYGRLFDWRTRKYTEESGFTWLMKLKKFYPHLVWMNPNPTPEVLNFWTETHLQLADMFPMFQLTTEGLEDAMKRLMVRRS
jgi:uncharacterized protein with von Willebrand factor type A (vWA) domain